jgi:hypothetical protein
MRKILLLCFITCLSLVFAVPAPQQIVITLSEAFTVQGLDSATFEDMSFSLESVTMTGENPQVMVALALGESDEAETLLLELPAAASVEVGDYTLTLLSATVPKDPDMSCAVSTATLILEKTESAL